jgi:diguanylate cyclase (GGDEF)-like protein
MLELHDVYTVAFAITAAISLVVAWLSWRRHPSAGAGTLTVLMLGVATWTAAEVFVWWTPTLTQEKFWLAITYVGLTVVNVSVLVFAFDVREMRVWRTPKRILLISIVPALLCLVAMTDPGGLFYKSFVAQQVGSYTHYAPVPGPLFWVYTASMYSLLLTAFILIARTYTQSSGAKRIEAGTVLIGLLAPFIVSIVNQATIQLEGLEGVAFLFTGLVFVFALERGRLLDENGRLVTAGDLAQANAHRERLAAANDGLSEELEKASLAATAMHDLATHDSLTGLYNRRALAEHFTRVMAQSRQAGSAMGLIMLDIDHFQNINDQFSYAAGDAALVLVAECLLAGSRPMDIVCRYGRDEFLMIMPDTDIKAVHQNAEELRARIEALTSPSGWHGVPVSVSIGVSAFPHNGTTEAELMAAAGRALRVAKESGRGRTVAA